MGTGSYGAGLARYLSRSGVEVVGGTRDAGGMDPGCHARPDRLVSSIGRT